MFRERGKQNGHSKTLFPLHEKTGEKKLFKKKNQWHPEKPASEFSDGAIPHDHAAISVGHYLADLFMDHARQSPHKPASIEQELADLIYNTKPVFTAREIVMEASYDGPDITYFFDKQVAPHDRDPEEERGGGKQEQQQQERMTVS